jgi:hypothetical protein
MVKKVIFEASCNNCENKILVLQKVGNLGTYTLRALDKARSTTANTETISKINEIAKIFQDSSVEIRADNAQLESVAKRINDVKKKHNKSPIRQFLKRIIPKFIFDRLPFACLTKYQGADFTKEIFKNKHLKDIEKVKYVFSGIKGESVSTEDVHKIETACKENFSFSPMKFVLENPEKSIETLKVELKAIVTVAEGLHALLDPADIKESLEKTIEHLCEKYQVTELDIKKEANLFGVNNTVAKMKMIKRLIIYLGAGLDPKTHSPSIARRQEATGFEISILKGIEKIFKKAFLSGSKEVSIEQLKDSDFSIIVSGKTVIIEEKTAGKGAFKVATFSSDYFGMQSPAERKRYVTVRLIKKEDDNTLHKNKEKESSIKKGLEENPAGKDENLDLLIFKQGHEQLMPPEVEEALKSTAFVKGTGSIVIKESGQRGVIPSFELSEKESLDASVNPVTNSVVINSSDTADSIESTVKNNSEILKQSAETGGVLLNKGGEMVGVLLKKCHGKAAGKKLLNLINIALLPQKKYVPQFADLIKYDLEDPVHFKGLPYHIWRTGALNRELENLTKEEEKGNNIDKEMKDTLQQIIDDRKIAKKELNAFEIPDDLEDYSHEIDVTQKLQGSGVIGVFTVVDLSSGEKIMVLDAAGYKLTVKGDQEGTTEEVNAVDLKELAKLRRKGKLDDMQILQMMTILDDAFDGVERMHSMGYIHRDLKPANILITKEGRGALADFGTVCQKENDPAKSNYFGTPRYSAPEVCAYSDSDQWKIIDEKSDVWSAGMILMQCCIEGKSLKDHPAINGTNPHLIKTCLEEMMQKPQEGDVYIKKWTEPTNKNSLEHLIWESTQLYPEKRPTMAEFRKKFNQIRYTLQKMVAKIV